MNIDNRQPVHKPIRYLKVNRQMTNADYQRVVRCPPRTATRDLNSMVEMGIIALRGKGRGAHYVLVRKRATNAPNRPPQEE